MRAAISILAAAAFALPGGCATQGSIHRLADVDWRAVDVNGAPTAGDGAPTLRLGGDRTITGSAGCNTYTGRYRRLSEQRLEIGPLATTRRACAGPAMEQEQRYLLILGGARGYSLYADGSLSLIAPDGRAIRFRRADGR